MVWNGNGSEIAQNGPEIPQNGPEITQNGPEMAQNGPERVIYSLVGKFQCRDKN